MNGWLHVLEDSEITLLLMVACGRGTLVATSEADISPGVGGDPRRNPVEAVRHPPRPLLRGA